MYTHIYIIYIGISVVVFELFSRELRFHQYTYILNDKKFFTDWAIYTFYNVDKVLEGRGSVPATKVPIKRQINVEK